MKIKINKKIILSVLMSFILSVSWSALTSTAAPWENDTRYHEDTPFNDQEIRNGDKIISISFRDTDLKQIMRMFADKMGFNIVFVGEVSGSVTMDLVDCTLKDALNIVTEANKITYIIDNSTMVVMSVQTAATTNYTKKSMRVVPIKYTDAGSVAEFLNKNVFGLGKPGYSSGEIVVTNPSRNEIIIFGTNNDYEMAKRIINKIDIKPQTTTYKINHVTPKEMAQLVCDSLFSSTADAGTSRLAGILTGAADADISIGAEKIACKVATAVQSTNIASFKSVPLTVMYNSGLGTISVLGGSKEQIQLINEFILMHDKKQQQAILELAVLELNEKGSQLFQNEWHFTNNTFPVSFQNGTLKLGSLIFFGNDTPATSGLNRGGMPALWDTITWVEKTGKGKLLQKPTIIITNGTQSIIDLTQDYIEKTDSQVSSSTFSQTPVVTRTYTIGEDQGMKISIKPFISTDGYVTMDLEVEYATPYHTEQGVDQLGNSYTAATLLERRNITLGSVRVKNGETLMLGGLIYQKDTQNIDKIPLLGDIPGLGVFFRNTASEKQKNELVIMITPRIIDDTEDAVDI
ncbi:MAG: hypothetical protein K6E29_08025 [Cyanobacteria bacterium RUI128]|nr:hypothetical protein [Cyanobacteria bacterium RUI128]